MKLYTEKILKLSTEIPLIGKIIIPQEVGEGLFGVSFKMKGKPGKIKTTINPIKTLTPRFITRALEKQKKTHQNPTVRKFIIENTFRYLPKLKNHITSQQNLYICILISILIVGILHVLVHDNEIHYIYDSYTLRI